MILSSTSDVVRVITDASADVEHRASYVDKSGSPPYTVVLGRTTPGSITTATTTTIIPSPASGVQRKVLTLSLSNNHASVSVTVTVEFFDGTDAAQLFEVVLGPEETLAFVPPGQWFHKEAGAGDYTSIGPMATDADMESGTSNVVYTPPGRLHRHPSMAKFWAHTIPGNLIGVSYNVTSSADPTAGVCNITIGTDFSSANWCCVGISYRQNTTTTVTNAKHTAIRFNTLAAGSVSLETYDQTATNFAIEDPLSWMIVGFGDQ